MPRLSRLAEIHRRRTTVGLTLLPLLVACGSCATNAATDARPPAPPVVAAPCPTPEAPVCKSPKDAIEEQADAWLSAMTLDEKLALLGGTGFDTVGVPRLHVPALRMTDGPVGVRTGQATAFPASVLLAATFDPDLAQRVGAAIARETKSHGKNVILGPAVNIVRSARNGRNFEYLGEDPLLAGRIAAGYIRGVQSEGVLATVKHLAVNNQETERRTISAEIDQRTLHEIYLPAFETAVKDAGVWAVMCAYNRVNGVYACEHEGLLDQVLRKQWGFRGLMMSDWGADHSFPKAMRAGLDLEMPVAVAYKPAVIRKALEDKTIDAAMLDEVIRRQLRAIAALRMEEQVPERPEDTDTPEHRTLNHVAAREGLVLLKNEGLLPLDRSKLRRIAVVGPRGDHIDGGGGSAHVAATRQVSLVTALKQVLGDKVKVDFAPGEITLDGLEPIPASVLTPPAGHDGKGLLGEYFPNRDFSGTPKMSRVDARIAFQWDLGAPAPGFPEENFSARWTGKLTPTESGLYLLGVRSDDGARLYVDGKLVVDNWGDHPPTLKTVQMQLVAGKSYDLRLDYYEYIIGASVELLWRRGERDPMRRVAEIAKGADVVIAAVGDGMGDETEGDDRGSLALPGQQDEIVRTAAKVNPRVVVVTTTGAAVAMPWLDQVKSVLHAWFPGQEGGRAMADVLLGEVSPSGKLPVTFPKRLEDEPCFGNFPGKDGKVVYKEGILVGYRGYDTRKVEPMFPFGYGLSYTSFAYSDLRVSAFDPVRGATVRLKVKNTGRRRGAEIVQLYVHAPDSAVERAEQELRGFARADLAAGEEREIVIALPTRAFAYYDASRPQADAWRVAPGTYEIRAAASSRDVRARASVTVPGKSR